MANDVRGIEEDGGSVGYVYLLACVAALGGLLFGYDTAVIYGAIGYLTQYFKLDVDFAAGLGRGQRALGVRRGHGPGRLPERLAGTQTHARPGRAHVLRSRRWGRRSPNTIGVFVVFRLLAGMAIGVASISSPMYIAEVAPAQMRGRMVSINQLAIVTGILLAYFVNLLHRLLRRNAGPTGTCSTAGAGCSAAAAVPSVFFLAPADHGAREPPLARPARPPGRGGAGARPRQRPGAGRRVELAVIEKTIAEESGSLSQLLPAGHAHRADDRHRAGRAPADHRDQRLPLLRLGDLQEDRLGARTPRSCNRSSLVGST